MVFDCEHCGATGFVHRGALGGHKSRNSRCRHLQRAAPRVQHHAARDRAAAVTRRVTGIPSSSDIPAAAFVESAVPDYQDTENQVDAHRQYPELGDLVDTTDSSDAQDSNASLSSGSSTSSGSTSDTESILMGTKAYDSSLHLAHFIRHCRNRVGLSQNDTKLLLTTLFHPSFRLDEVRFRTLQEFKVYKGELISNYEAEVENGCEWHEVVLCPGESELKLRYRDPVRLLGKLFSDKKNKHGSVLKAQGGNEGYASAQTGLWWHEMETHVNCDGAVIAPLVLYSDATSLSNDQRTSGYPLVMSLGNIASSVRSLEHGHALVAILPIVGANEPVVLNAINPRLKKLELFQQCLKVILQPLKDASYSGLHLKDPYGCGQWVYPMLYSYIADHPEGCMVSCTFDTNKCAFPCSVCMCPKDLLSSVDLRHEWRTEASMQALQNQLGEMICGGQSTAATRLSTENSVHPVECALLGFNGGDTELGNCFGALQVEILHEADLGLAKMLVAAPRGVAAGGLCLVQKPLEVMDRRLHILQTQQRYSAFRIPGSNNHGYFTSNA